MNGKVSTDYNHRNVYIDALRFFLFCAVVIAHMYTSDFVVKLQVSSVIDALMRFCVPCFFMISGYFLPEKIENIWTYLKKSFVRLFTPFIFWEIVYNLLNCVFHFAITDPINSGMDIIKNSCKDGRFWRCRIPFVVFTVALGLSCYRGRLAAMDWGAQKRL